MVMNGPNLNLLGVREKSIYGDQGFESYFEDLKGQFPDIELAYFQSNHEGEIVDWIQAAVGEIDAMVINAGAYTHTSVAIHDALKAFTGFKLELHISNPHAREAFRQN